MGYTVLSGERMPGPLRNLARHLLDRVSGPHEAGARYTGSAERALARLHDGAESAFNAVGAAAVSSWEVLLADLARALSQLPAEQRAALITRVSDALVPTVAPLQHGERPFRAALQQGVQAAARSGQLADAVEPLIEHLESLGEPVANGWAKTTAFLAPLYDALAEPDALRGALAFTGGELRGVFDNEAALFRARMEALPRATSLDAALLDALAAWQQGVVRGIEVAIYGARTRLVGPASRARAAG